MFCICLMYYADANAVLHYFTLHNLYVIFNIAPHIITLWIEHVLGLGSDKTHSLTNAALVRFQTTMPSASMPLCCCDMHRFSQTCYYPIISLLLSTFIFSSSFSFMSEPGRTTNDFVEETLKCPRICLASYLSQTQYLRFESIGLRILSVTVPAKAEC